MELMINVAADWFEDSSDVLLIAGDSDIAEMYRMKLEMDGYRVSTIADVGDSTAHAAGWRPDMVLLDLGAGSGAQLRDLQRLRADPLLSGVPVLLVSSRSEEELRQRGFALGPTDYLLRTV
jgi:DNA-binding response OmpR family regulator